MTPIQVIAVLFWTAVVASTLALVFDRHLRESLNSVLALAGPPYAPWGFSGTAIPPKRS